MRDEPRLDTTRGVRAAVTAVAVSAVLAGVKVLAGVIGHSYALIADGMESMLDIMSSLVVLGGIRIAEIPPDRKHPYGHGKAESMAALVVAVGLLVAAVGIAVQSVRQILAPQQTPAAFTLVVLVVVIATKELLYSRLSRVGEELRSTSLHADAWHHRSDALTSLAAFVGISVALIGGPGYESADGWAALLACGVIAVNGIQLLRTAVSEVMDEAAPSELVERIRAVAEGVPGVEGVDKCLARKSGPWWLVDIHVLLDGALTVAEGHALGHRVKDELLRADLGVLDALVHIEPVEQHASGEPRGAR